LTAQAPALWRTISEVKIEPHQRERLGTLLGYWFMERFRTLPLTEIRKMFQTLTPLQETRAYQEIFAHGKIASLKRLVTRRFGTIPEWADERIEEADSEQIDHWLDDVLYACSLQQLLWLPTDPAIPKVTRASVSIILPARNEASALFELLPKLRAQCPAAEILVIDDGSTDATAEIATEHGARVISHPLSLGNGAAIKTGARHAGSDILVFMDADGQHQPADIPRLLARLHQGHDMVIGARSQGSQANWSRGLANAFYNRLASYMTGHPIPDLTSGFRAVRAARFRQFLYLLPNGFSYPTTITMAFFRAGLSVAYEPIQAQPRIGRSHIRPLKDGLRFLLIIFKIGTLYSPLKLFVPIAAAHALLGLGYYVYTYFTAARISLATLFLLSAAVTIFLIGLVSEQITQLSYKDNAQH
jgi:glycosyltransferase involved in cell wall biosynthesis